MKAKLIYIFIFITSLSGLAAGDKRPVPKMIFEENKSQWPRQVMFEADFGGGKLFLEKNTFTYLLVENVNFHDHNRKEKGAPLIHYHSFKVNFENSNSAAAITGNKMYSFPRNYYLGNDPSKWAEGVRLYEGASYKNLYPSIDMNVYGDGQHLKYDLIVNPGGSAENIKFNYEGADKMYLEYGNLYIQTSLGVVEEQKPYAYQVIDGVKMEVSCSYHLKNNSLGFDVNEKYNKDYPLVIDPVLVASTYTGSFSDNWGFTATYDEAGNIYSAGIAATAGYPTTLGAFDNTFNGGMPWYWMPGAGPDSWPFDISITKYNATGSTILFSTYYGGSLNEQPHSLIVNSNNELYVAGRTNSPDFPVTAGAYDASYNGGYDIIVGKFNSTGALLASTFIGGTGDDGVNISEISTTFSTLKFNYADDGRSEIILDNNSNVYVAGSSRSADFPTSAGAFDASLGGSQDGVVFKMNSTLSALTFSTYLGGSNDDAAYGLKLDAGNNVYVAGGTASADFPTTAGVLHPAFQGGLADGYVAALNSSGTALLYSTYLGTSTYDQAYLIETDVNGDIYVFGQTQGAYPVTPGIYSNPNSGQFIHKMNKQLNTTLFSTVIGTGTPNPNISPTAFLVDSCQNIYIAGWGRCGNGVFDHPFPSSVTGMPVTANAFQHTTDGCDFYFMVLRPNAQSLLYATFFGEVGAPVPDHVDGGTSRFDKRGFIYESACASCWGNDNFPTTPTAWSRHNNSSYYGYFRPWNCNNAVFKIDLRVIPVAVANITGPPSGCVPYTVTFTDAGSSGTNYKWNFGDGSPMVLGASTVHTYTSTGSFTASLYVSDSTGTCGQIDTAKYTINVGGPPVLVTSQTGVSCNGGNNGTASVTATGGFTPYTYSWNNGQTSMTASGLTAGSYNVTVTNSYGCSASALAVVPEPAVLTANTTFTNVGCYGGSTAAATASVNGGSGPYTYLWLPGGFTSSSVSGLSINSYTMHVTDSKGCTASSSANITQPAALSITAAATQAICGQANGSANVSGTGGFSPYSWTWSGGQTGANVSGLTAGTYTVTLTDINLCTASLPVSIADISGPSAAITASNVSCNGAGNGSAVITTTGGTLPFTYLWNNGQTTPAAVNLAPGIYSVTVTDNHNCSAATSIAITEPAPLDANAIGVNPTCFGFLNGSAQVSVLGGTAPYSYLWAVSGSPVTAAISGLGSGVYNVTVTDFNGCIKTASVSLIDPNPVNTFISTVNVTCVGICSGTATASAVNGAAPYSFSWNDPAHQTMAAAIGLCAGSYSVVVTDAHGCPSQAAAVIGSPVPLTSSVIAVGNTSCFGSCNGFVQLSPAGGSPPYSYSWMPGGLTSASVTGLCAGTYTCTITDSKGCTSLSIDTISQPPSLTSIITVNKSPCNGLCDGAITADFAGGSPPYSFLWMPGLQTIYNPSTLCAGSNSVTVTDANGCSVSGAVMLTQLPPLFVSISTSSSNCGQANGGACANATGGSSGYRYLWNVSPADTLSCITGMHANTYNVLVTDEMGCTITSVANINDIATPTLTITGSTNVSCFGAADGTAAATVTSGVPPYSLFWTPGGQTILSPVNLGAGVNTLTVTDNAGCVSSSSVIISGPPQIVSAFTNRHNISCYGLCDGSGSILFGGGTPPLSIIWNDPGAHTSANVSGLCAGSYKVTITDSIGCVKIDSSILITQPNLLSVQNSVLTDITCHGFNDGIISAAVSGGTPFYSFSWLPNVSSTAIAANLTAGNYSFTVTDLNGCSASITKNVTEPPVLSASGSFVRSSCNFSNGSASVMPAGGTPSYNYQWNDLNLQTTATAQNLSAGNYVCIIKDVNNCSIRDTVAFTAIPGPAIDSITSTQIWCFGNNTGKARVFPNSVAGTPPLTYLWTPTSQTTDTASGLVHGAYSVLITDANGCTVNGSVIVSQRPVLSLTGNPIDTICFGDTAQVYAQASGGTPNYSYNWLGASGAGLTGAGPHIVLPAGNTIYSVNVIDAHGCAAATLNMQVIVRPPLSVIAAADQQVCEGLSANITAVPAGGNGGPYTYSWSNGPAVQSQSVNPTVAASPASYIVTLNDGCSKPASDTTVVIVIPGPAGVFTESDTSGCIPLTVHFNASSNNGVTYIWNFGDSNSGSGASVTHTYLNSGLYIAAVTIISAAGCRAPASGGSIIKANPLPNADFIANINLASMVDPVVSFQDLSTAPISSWLWNFGDPSSSTNSAVIQNPSHTFSAVGTFNVQLIVTNQYGCLDTAYQSITANSDVVFPNAFSPNESGSSGGTYNLSDLSNDVFFPYTYGVIEFKLEIFNRWGELIFVSDDIKIGWDGYYRGKICQPDVYIWKAYVKLNGGKIFNKCGDVTLIR